MAHQSLAVTIDEPPLGLVASLPQPDHLANAQGAVTRGWFYEHRQMLLRAEVAMSSLLRPAHA